ncbi:hypothetical protein [Chromobacterium haemolyticum]|uniref:hypothetical protein n=1 Tax=Chromobacterium haemolyticum TaxID=394935 RepID=UPI0009DFBADE|nr:hypothetical protein [Chromobacterium haemolyticum]
MRPTLSFHLQTIPNVPAIRQLYELDGEIGEADVADFVLQRCRAQSSTDFIPFHLHRVVAIAGVLQQDGHTRLVQRLAVDAGDEAAMLADWLTLLRDSRAQLISWDGSRLDLPVLLHRALALGLQLPEQLRAGRTPDAHCALSEILSGGHAELATPLGELARLCGLPGEAELNGPRRWELYRAGNADALAEHNARQAASCHLLWLRQQWVEGALTPATHQACRQSLRAVIAAQPEPHWRGWLAEWREEAAQGD